jgi:hypothetical protein
VVAIYKAHPMFAAADFELCYPPEGADGHLELADFGLASMEGVDIMPIGDTVITLFVRDEATANPAVVQGSGRSACGRAPRRSGFHVTVEDDFPGVVADALGVLAPRRRLRAGHVDRPSPS